MKDKLSPKQRRFVAEYLKDQNGTRAAARAGYSKHTANEQAARLLAKASIRSAVNAKLEKIEEEVLVDKEFVIGGLRDVSLRCRQARPVMVRDPADGRKFIQKLDEETGEGVWEFDSSGANRSLELLGKHLGLFTDRILIADSLEKLLAASNPPVEK